MESLAVESVPVTEPVTEPAHWETICALGVIAPNTGVNALMGTGMLLLLALMAFALSNDLFCPGGLLRPHE